MSNTHVTRATKTSRAWRLLGLAALLLLALAACSSPFTSPTESSESSDASLDSAEGNLLSMEGPVEPVNGAKLALYLKDFPLRDREVTSVMIDLRQVAVCGELGGWQTVFIAPDGRALDLLELVEEPAYLGTSDLPVDSYTQVRLVLGPANFIVVSGEDPSALTVPSGQQSGIKIVGGFEVREGFTTRLLLDFDAQKSIHLTGRRGYKMRPVIRLEEVSYEELKSSGQPPTASFPVPAITGSSAIGKVLAAAYLYSDPDGDPEGQSLLQWYRFDAETDTTGGTAIPGATGLSYTSTASDSGKWLRFQVIPVDSTGAVGEPALSEPVRINTRVVVDTWSDPFAANDTYLTLIDARGGLVAEDDDGNPAQGTYNVGCSRIDVAAGLPAGSYYAKVHKPTDTGNPNYGFRVADYDPGTDFPPIVPANEDESLVQIDDAVDATTGVPTAPWPVQLGEVVSRSIFPTLTDDDWYGFVIE